LESSYSFPLIAFSYDSLLIVFNEILLVAISKLKHSNHYCILNSLSTASFTNEGIYENAFSFGYSSIFNLRVNIYLHSKPSPCMPFSTITLYSGNLIISYFLQRLIITSFSLLSSQTELNRILLIRLITPIVSPSLYLFINSSPILSFSWHPVSADLIFSSLSK